MSSDEFSRIREENFERAQRAVGRDDVDALKDAQDVFPEFHTMGHFNSKENLLQLSCRFKSKKVFDYLLNLNCFDLEAVDSRGHTILMNTILDGYRCDYYCVKLINAGADVFKILDDGRTFLHEAIHENLLETAELLLQKGLDPNAQDKYGRTLLHSLLEKRDYYQMDEAVGLLLQYGADTAIYDDDGYLPFDYAVMYKWLKLSIQEHLFYCTFDSHSADYIMPSMVFNRLLNSLLFDIVIDVVSDVILEKDSSAMFFCMLPSHLKKFIESYPFLIRRAFSIMKLDDDRAMCLNIYNTEVLVNSELYFETAEMISTMKLWRIYSCCISGSRERSDLILYLLSYGLNVTRDDCQRIYESQGYCDFFKTMLLHLNYVDTSRIDCPMIEIIVDIHCDLNTILAKFDRSSFCKLKPLLDYFANPELRLLCEGSNEPDLINKVEQLPTLPSLLQLARDETRRHIVRRLKLEKPSQYYWVLRKLGIGTIYEDILSFQTKLYV